MCVNGSMEGCSPPVRYAAPDLAAILIPAAVPRARSLAFAEKIGSPRLIGKTLCYLGHLSIDRGRFAEAVAPLRRAADLTEQTGDVLLRALAVTRLGTSEECLGDPRAAIERHHRALGVISGQTNVEIELEIRNRLGGSHLASGELTEARGRFEWVLTRTETAGDPVERAYAVDGIGHCGFPGETHGS